MAPNPTLSTFPSVLFFQFERASPGPRFHLRLDERKKIESQRARRNSRGKSGSLGAGESGAARSPAGVALFCLHYGARARLTRARGRAPASQRQQKRRPATDDHNRARRATVGNAALRRARHAAHATIASDAAASVTSAQSAPADVTAPN